MRNAFSTEARSSLNVLKYFKGVDFFLVYFHSFSIGLNCGENLGQAMDRRALGVCLTKLLDRLAARIRCAVLNQDYRPGDSLQQLAQERLIGDRIETCQPLRQASVTGGAILAQCLRSQVLLYRLQKSVFRLEALPLQCAQCLHPLSQRAHPWP